MMFHQQNTKHNPPESYGDCMRTCVACLLDRDPANVPNWFDPGQIDDRFAPDPWVNMEEWLIDAGYCSVKIAVPDQLAEVSNYMGIMNPGLLHILMGNEHAVIACGGNILHDPSWLQLGVKNPEYMMFILPASMKYTGE